jgi:hypothetical protein
VVGGGEAVDVTVEHEVFTRRPAFEGPDDVGELGLRRDDAIGESGCIEKACDVCGRFSRIAGRIWAFGLHELA